MTESTALQVSWEIAVRGGVRASTFSHPWSRNFMVGKVGRDQIEDYAPAMHDRRRSRALAVPEPGLRGGVTEARLCSY
jgi:hypothetical protein